MNNDWKLYTYCLAIQVLENNDDVTMLKLPKEEIWIHTVSNDLKQLEEMVSYLKHCTPEEFQNNMEISVHEMKKIGMDVIQLHDSLIKGREIMEDTFYLESIVNPYVEFPFLKFQNQFDEPEPNFLFLVDDN